MSKSSSAADVKLASNYESLRATLLGRAICDRLDPPAGFLGPAERSPAADRVPGPHAARPARAQSFDQLAATAGIGRKKLETFIKLLVRATKEDAAEAKIENLPGADEAAGRRPRRERQVRSAARFRNGLDAAGAKRSAATAWAARSSAG